MMTDEQMSLSAVLSSVEMWNYVNVHVEPFNPFVLYSLQCDLHVIFKEILIILLGGQS